MSILISFLMVVNIIVCLLLILVVLMQRPRQEGLGAAFGGDMTSQMFGAQTTNVLQKFTVYLAIILFVLTAVLAVLVSKRETGESKRLFPAPESVEPAEVPTDAAPAADAGADGAAPMPADAAKKDEAPAAPVAPAPAVTSDAKAKAKAKAKAVQPAAPATPADAPKSEEAPQTAAPETTPAADAPAAATPAAPAMKEPEAQ